MQGGTRNGRIGLGLEGARVCNRTTLVYMHAWFSSSNRQQCTQLPRAACRAAKDSCLLVGRQGHLIFSADQRFTHKLRSQRLQRWSRVCGCACKRA